MYLDLVDDIKNDEECRFFDQMNFSGENLDVVELQPITQAPSLTYPIREKLEDQTNEQDL